MPVSGSPPSSARAGLDEELAVELAAIAVDVAVAAGLRAREWRAAGFAITSKSTPTDLVTEVDRGVERWITEELARRRPADGVVGEEGANVDAGSRVRWLIDPIDGTVNFALGIAQYGVSVAAEVEGQVLAGCVCNPETGEVFHARRDGGAFRALLAQSVPLDAPSQDSWRAGYLSPDRPLSGGRAVSIEQAVIGTGFGYDAARRARQGAVVGRLLPRVADIRRFGAASLDLCAVAMGRLDGYFEAGLNQWDWAAGLLIAAEAGCVSSGLRDQAAGNRFTAVAGPAMAPDFFALLTELDADRVLTDQ